MTSLSLKVILATLGLTVSLQASASCPASTESLQLQQASAIQFSDATDLRLELESQGQSCAFELGLLHRQLAKIEQAITPAESAEWHLRQAAGYMSYSYQYHPEGLITLIDTLAALADQQQLSQTSKGNWQQTRIAIVEIIANEKNIDHNSEQYQLLVERSQEQQLALASLNSHEQLNTAAGS